MRKISYITAGESHGKGLTAIIEGLPSGFDIDIDRINKELELRQMGIGRGNRMKIEKDKIEILSGIIDKKTIGSPIALFIENKDWDNWKDIINPEKVLKTKSVTQPRPGHADLSGIIKYNFNDARYVLERSSARETAIRTAIGNICRQILENFGINIYSYIKIFGGVELPDIDTEELKEKYLLLIKDSPYHNIIDNEIKEVINNLVNHTRQQGDTLGGKIKLVITNVPIGLGSYVHWERKIDSILAQHVMSLQAIKSVEIGAGVEVANMKGSEVHDEIFLENGKITRGTNNAGGIEGGMTNGEPIIISAAMKPIPTLMKPKYTFNILTGEKVLASTERSDVCALKAASIVLENIIAIPLLDFILEKFGGDNKIEILKRYKQFQEEINSYWNDGGR